MAASAFAGLHAVRDDFRAPARAERLALLARTARRRLRSARALERYHDDLLFLCAFPPDPATRDGARAELDRFGRRVAQARSRDALELTGITGSTTRAVLAAPVVCRLVARYPGELDLDWSGIRPAERVDPLIRRSLLRSEEEAFDGGDLSTRQWLRRARGASGMNDLEWLVAQRPRSGAARREWDRAFDALELPVRWRLRGSAGSVTALRWDAAPAAFRSGFRRTPGRSALARSLEQIVLLAPDRADEAIAVATAALAARGREVHAITHANRDEVYLADLGEGVSVLVLGAAPGARMAIESTYGYLLLANGIPIGYGGVTPVAWQANTGLNVFPAFRGSEAGAVFSLALRAFATLFGVTRFLVNPVQFGEDNAEAIASGAFWFYWRLGFRPVDPAARRLAVAEQRRRKARPSYRSTPATLRRLAAGDLVLARPGSAGHPLVDERVFAALGLRVTDLLAGAAARGRTHARVVRETARRLHTDRRGWSMAEREAFADLAPVLSLLPLERWTVRGRRSLVALIRAKGGPGEREFVRVAQGLARFWRELARLGSGVSAPGAG